MNPSQKINPNPEAVFRELKGESVLLHLTDARYFGLDNLGTSIWQLIDEHGNLKEVLTGMRREYDVYAWRLKADLAQLVGELAEKGGYSVPVELRNANRASDATLL